MQHYPGKKNLILLQKLLLVILCFNGNKSFSMSENLIWFFIHWKNLEEDMKYRLFFQALYEGNMFEFINSVNMEQDLLNNWAVDLIISQGEIIFLSVFAKGIIKERYESEVFICSAYLTARVVHWVFPLWSSFSFLGRIIKTKQPLQAGILLLCLVFFSIRSLEGLKI